MANGLAIGLTRPTKTLRRISPPDSSDDDVDYFAPAVTNGNSSVRNGEAGSFSALKKLGSAN